MSNKRAYLNKLKEICRCCLDNMGTKSMWEEHFNNEEREVYGQMLMECFAVTWDSEKVELICESCITRLREAVKLKIEFLAVQELLQENLVLGNGTELPIYDFKTEFKEEDYAIEDNSHELYLDEFNEQISNVEVKIESIDSLEDSEAIFISDNQPMEYPKKKRGKRKKMYKQYTKEDMERAIEAVRVHGNNTLEAATKFSVPRKTLALRLLTSEENGEKKDIAEEKKTKLIEEIRTILKYTNATPFKTKMSKCYCAYCFTDGPIFDDPDELRAHTKSSHGDRLIRQVELFMRPSYLNEVLKMDITELECTECNIMINDWNSMFVHFAETHDLVFDEAYNKIIPYSIVPDNKCVLCYDSFLNFSQLDIHMNAHYCNYICYECGDPFVSSMRLDIHLKGHKTGKYPCQMCEKVFAFQQHKIKHMTLVHNKDSDMKNIIPKTSSNASNTASQRYNNTQNENKDKYQVMTCEYCGKCFSSKVSFYAHVKKVHSKTRRHKVKKNYVCGVCGQEFEKIMNLRHHWREHMELIPFHRMETINLS